MADQENINKMTSTINKVLSLLKECEDLAGEELQRIEALKQEKATLLAEIDALHQLCNRQAKEAGQPDEEVKEEKTVPEVVMDKFQGRRSLNDHIAAKPNRAAIPPPIQDISRAIGLNDRLMFIRELFDGKSEDYTQAISRLNEMGTMDQAMAFLESHLPHWDATGESAQLFIAIIHRRYL